MVDNVDLGRRGDDAVVGGRREVVLMAVGRTKATAILLLLDEARQTFLNTTYIMTTTILLRIFVLMKDDVVQTIYVRESIEFYRTHHDGGEIKKDGNSWSLG